MAFPPFILNYEGTLSSIHVAFSAAFEFLFCIGFHVYAVRSEFHHPGCYSCRKPVRFIIEVIEEPFSDFHAGSFCDILDACADRIAGALRLHSAELIQTSEDVLPCQDDGAPAQSEEAAVERFFRAIALRYIGISSIRSCSPFRMDFL